jgi:hypothetical protein
VFTTGAGAKLSAAEIGHYVGFETDSYDPETGAGWSVVVNGLAEIVDSAEETARLDALGLKSWAGAAGRVWVRIRPVSISGRHTPARAAPPPSVETAPAQTGPAQTGPEQAGPEQAGPADG